MSDFAALLGKINDTAKKAATASKTASKRSCSSSSNSGNSQNGNEVEKESKRRRKGLSNEESDQSTNIYIKPRDAYQLTLDVSFLCIGAQKAGTTWLHKMLCHHEKLSLPKQKEVHFFDWNRRKGLGWYCNQFPRMKYESNLHYGEITPCYAVLKEKDICEIKSLFPDIKIIFIARNLVDRAWSAILMELINTCRGLSAGVFANEFDDKELSPRERDRIERESDPNQYNDSYFMERLMHSTHTLRSDYATSLRLWLKHFPKDQLLILDYNEMSKNPKGFIKNVCKHLGVENEKYIGSLDEKELSTRVNAAMKDKKHTIRPSLRKSMENYLKPFNDDFNNLLLELGHSWRL